MSNPLAFRRWKVFPASNVAVSVQRNEHLRIAPGVSILQGLNEMLNLISGGLQLQRVLGCTDAIESLTAALRQALCTRQR